MTQAMPAYHELMWPSLKALEAIGGSGTIQEINTKVIEMAGFPEEQLTVLHGNGPQTELAYRFAWARSYLKAVGAVENSARGVWAITDDGRMLTETDMAAIPPKVRAMYRSGGRARRGRHGEPPDEEPTGPEPEGTEWKDELLEVLLGLQPDRFERLTQRLLRESGFISVEVKGRSGDGGIDGVGVLRMSLLSFPVYFQCKRYRGSVGPNLVRDFRGAMAGRGDKGLIVTTGTFTRDAEREARRDGVPAIDLIDGDRLCDLLKDMGLGVSTQQVEEVAVEAGWFDEL
jgi:restriction system protein